MKLALVTRSCDQRAGAGGYAGRLIAQLEQQHEVEVIGLEQRAGLRFAWRHRSLTEHFSAVLSLERTLNHDLVRAGGGFEEDAARSVGKRPCRRRMWLQREGWARASVVVANSEMVAHRLHGLTRSRIAVVRTGVDLKRFAPRPHSTTGRVLFAAHGWQRKGFDRAIEAVAALPMIELWVAGRDQRRRRRLAAARARLGARVVDLGPSVDLAEVLHQVDAVLHPTRYDPASNLVLECMAAGVPVVTTDQDGSSELLPTALVAKRDALPALRVALEGGVDLGGALRRKIEAWPDSRNASEMEALLWECTRWRINPG